MSTCDRTLDIESQAGRARSSPDCLRGTLLVTLGTCYFMPSFRARMAGARRRLCAHGWSL